MSKNTPATFTGIDLAATHVTPETWDKLFAWADDFSSPDAPLWCNVVDGGCGILIFTFTAYEADLPPDLRPIVRMAQEHDHRFIVLDTDGEICDLFPSYEEQWAALDAEREA